MVETLVAYRILRHELENCLYTVHPLIREHYYNILTFKRDEAKEAHTKLKDYYFSMAPDLSDLPDCPSLEDLRSLMEVVHHACQCGAYDEADSIRWEYISQKDEFYITSKLGAWETDLEVTLNFFPEGDTSQEPQVSRSWSKAWILREVGLCLTYGCLGNQAEGFFKRALKICLDSQDWSIASRCYQSLSDLYSLRGELDRGAKVAGEAIDLAQQAGDMDNESHSLAFKAWILHLQGDVEKAGRIFKEAEALARKIDSSQPYLNGIWGIRHANHLMRKGETDYAREVTESNLQIYERHHWPDDISRYHWILGDLCAQAGQLDSAAENYNQSLSIARNISNRLVLVGALLACGKWEACYLHDANAGLSDLTEALGYAKAAGYRIYEADIRIALAWAHLAAGNNDIARVEADYALQLSQDMGYYWGIVDAKEVLAKLDES